MINEMAISPGRDLLDAIGSALCGSAPCSFLVLSTENAHIVRMDISCQRNVSAIPQAT